MKYYTDNKEIKLNKELNKLDEFVVKFCRLLNEYVIVSGYVSILFGRSRGTEDVDLLIPNISKENFKKLFNKIYNDGFECLNTSVVDEAFDYLNSHAIRFALKRKPIPNIEFKIIKNDLDKYSFNNKIKVKLKIGELFISSLEMQIAYKLFLASEKDLEDAKHIYELFKKDLNMEELNRLISNLKVKKNFEKIK